MAVGQASCPTLPTYPLLYSPDLTLQVRVSCLLTWCCVVGKEVGGGPHAQPQRSRYKPGVEDLGQAVGQLGALEKNLGSQGWLEYLPACRLATVRAAPRVQTGKLRRQPDRGWGRAALVPGTRPWIPGAPSLCGILLCLWLGPPGCCICLEPQVTSGPDCRQQWGTAVQCLLFVT